MQDRFRFKIWDKEQKRFFSFEDFKKYEVEFNIDPDTNEVLCEYNDARYVVIQCIGLKDKNCKLIYEGDICKYKFEEIGEQKAIIYFNKELCSFLAKPLNDFQYTRINDCEVIGNIYENTELLEV